MATNTALAPCRAVTREEVARYQDKGWVLLRKVIDPAMIAAKRPRH